MSQHGYDILFDIQHSFLTDIIYYCAQIDTRDVVIANCLFHLSHQISSHNFNKTVLLCERRRHTTRRVASNRSAVLSPEGGTPSSPCWEYPILSWLGVTPSCPGHREVTQSSPGQWAPHPVLVRGVPIPSWDWGIPLQKGHESSGSILG